jgi:hypothetical protein
VAVLGTTVPRVSGHAPRVPHSIVMAAVWPIGPWRSGDGGGTVKKKSKKEVEMELDSDAI